MHIKRMKVFLILPVLLICFTGCQNNKPINQSVVNKNLDSRYEIYDKEMIILLDKRTGSTWRNVSCDDKEKIPNCWESMRYIDEFKPTFEMQ